MTDRNDFIGNKHDYLCRMIDVIRLKFYLIGVKDIMDTLIVFAPATVANFIVGFDSLGASLECIDGALLGDIISISAASCDRVESVGAYAHKLPQNPDDNLVTKCRDIFNQHLVGKGFPVESVFLSLEKRLPVCSGLGSSSSSIVATLVALNAFYIEPFTKAELLLLAGQMEGVVSGSAHYDNVAPSLLGGLQLMMPGGSCETLPWFEDWLLVVYYPGIEVSTKIAREILPTSVALSEGVRYWQNFAGFVHALYKNDRVRAASLLTDRLVQPHRSKLIPHYDDGQKGALEAGALAFGISGSGPSCFAIVDSMETASTVQNAIICSMHGTETAFSKICKIKPIGARIIEKSIV
jgi:homoserine kinase